MADKVLLDVKDLHVEVAGKTILSGVDLQIKYGENHVLFGPNGSGKTTLINTLMGFGGYKVLKGDIIFKGKSIVGMSTDERARMGLGISFQRPPSVKGVKLRQLLALYAGDGGSAIEEYAEKLNFTDYLEREVNVGFSGGEIKRAELLQLLVQAPDMVFLDEPESGVDLENIALIGEAINYLLGRKQPIEQGESMKSRRRKRKSSLTITHTGHILNYMDADVGHILLNGRTFCQDNPREILTTISRCGYDECLRCMREVEQV